MRSCTTCGANFSDRSMKEFKAAPHWKNQCPACTKKLFEKYLREYLLKLFSPLELATYADEYFGLEAGKILSPGDEATISAITTRVYDRQGKAGSEPPATIGHAIAEFVAEFDEIAKRVPALRAGGLPKKAILAILIGGIALVVIAVIVFILY